MDGKKDSENGSIHFRLERKTLYNLYRNLPSFFEGYENFIDVRTSNVQNYSKSNPTSCLVYSGGHNLPTSYTDEKQNVMY